MTETNECAVFVPGQVKKDPKNKKDMQELHILCILSIRVAGTMGFLLSRCDIRRNSFATGHAHSDRWRSRWLQIPSVEGQIKRPLSRSFYLAGTMGFEPTIT